MDGDLFASFPHGTQVHVQKAEGQALQAEFQRVHRNWLLARFSQEEALLEKKGLGPGGGEAKVFLPPFLLRWLCSKWPPLLLESSSHRAGLWWLQLPLEHGPWAAVTPSALSL